MTRGGKTIYKAGTCFPHTRGDQLWLEHRPLTGARIETECGGVEDVASGLLKGMSNASDGLEIK